MRNLFIVGAGRSSTVFIEEVIKIAAKYGWFVTVADKDPDVAKKQIGKMPNARATWLDVNKYNDRKDILERADLVVSMLPSHLHIYLAIDCLKMHKPLVSPSSVSYDMFGFSNNLPNKDTFFIYENGIKPGIEVFLTSKLLDDIRKDGGKIKTVNNYLGGGLNALKSNPWKFSITWNQIGIITANQGTAQFLEDGKYRYLPYNRIYDAHKTIEIPGLGSFEAIPSRGSFFMEQLHGLKKIDTFIRGSLRNIGFCKAWNALIKLGLTDNHYPIFNSQQLTCQEFVESLVSSYPGTSTKERVAAYIQEEVDSDVMKKLEWLGLFSRKKIRLVNATPAEILEQISGDKWKLLPNQKDKSIVYISVQYEKNKQILERSYVIVAEGDSNKSAMSKVIGLPLAYTIEYMFKNQVFNNSIDLTSPEVYNQVIKQLNDNGLVIKKYDSVVQ